MRPPQFRPVYANVLSAPGRNGVYFSWIPDHSQLTDADNTKYRDLADADSGNKSALPDGQGE